MKTQLSMVFLASALMMGTGVAMADSDGRYGYDRYAENYSQGDYGRSGDRGYYRDDSDDGYRYQNEYGYNDRDDRFRSENRGHYDRDDNYNVSDRRFNERDLDDRDYSRRDIDDGRIMPVDYQADIDQGINDRR